MNTAPMNETVNTKTRILDAAQTLFNEKGYASTTVTEIARSIGISQGNLTYHFRTKRDLAEQLRTRTHERMKSHWAGRQEGKIEEDYIDHVLFTMRLAWEARFLLREHALIFGKPISRQGNPLMIADFAQLSKLLDRIHSEGLFRSDIEFDADILARLLWMNSRYWMDHLCELEGDGPVTWKEIERGVRHHLTALTYLLKPAAGKAFTDTMSTALPYMERYGSKLFFEDVV